MKNRDSELFYDGLHPIDKDGIIIGKDELARLKRIGTVVLNIGTRKDLQVGSVLSLSTVVDVGGEPARGNQEQVQIIEINKISESEMQVRFKVV